MRSFDFPNFNSNNQNFEAVTPMYTTLICPLKIPKHWLMAGNKNRVMHFPQIAIFPSMEQTEPGRQLTFPFPPLSPSESSSVPLHLRFAFLSQCCHPATNNGLFVRGGAESQSPRAQSRVLFHPPLIVTLESETTCEDECRQCCIQAS